MASGGSYIRLGGLWICRSKNGKPYLRGRFGGATVLIFKNGFKTTEKHPDYELCIAQSTTQETEEEVAESGSKTIDESMPF